MRGIIFTSAFVLALSGGAALAHQCPSMMEEIDQALPSADLSEDERQRVTDLRQEGEELHEAGDHAGSEAALGEAKDILGL
ncbi:hypothetical protein [Aquibaculum sediminis]|uniref:hypothetical protein n=1 Tax=Aquibaculum sediminis TaxID=3231907 RepID=UPI0034533A92